MSKGPSTTVRGFQALEHVPLSEQVKTRLIRQAELDHYRERQRKSLCEWEQKILLDLTVVPVDLWYFDKGRSIRNVCSARFTYFDHRMTDERAGNQVSATIQIVHVSDTFRHRWDLKPFCDPSLSDGYFNSLTAHAFSEVFHGWRDAMDPIFGLTLQTAGRYGLVSRPFVQKGHEIPYCLRLDLLFWAVESTIASSLSVVNAELSFLIAEFCGTVFDMDDGDSFDGHYNLNSEYQFDFFLRKK